MGNGFYFCIGAGLWFWYRSVCAYRKHDTAQGRYFDLKSDMWLLAAIVIGSLK